MADFKSRFKGLMFNVDGNSRRFSNFVYYTDNEKEIEVLSGLHDVERLDKAEPVKTAEKKTEGPKKAARKSSGE